MTSELDFLRDSLQKVTSGHVFSAPEMTKIINCFMNCKLDEEPFGLLASAFICSLKTRGETVDEIAGAAQSLRSHQIDVKLGPDKNVLLDTCGTGGDGAHLINISTITGLVVASLGVTVVKHGNRSVSSSCGSADLLEEMGYPLLSDAKLVSKCAEQTNFGFLFAPHFHPALKNLSGLRRSLGVRTLFNLLGPLVNPARATHQLIGVFHRELVSPLAQTAAKLGVKRCMVVHGEGGLDELSPAGVTWASLAEGESLKEMELRPEDFGAKPVQLEALAGGDAAQNSDICAAIFRGEKPDAASAVAMNCAASLWVTGDAATLAEGYQRSFEEIQSGRVGEFFEKAKAFARGLGQG